MVLKRKQWKQEHWTRPGAQLHRASGDYHDTEGFLLAPTQDRLTRTPGWSSHVAFPAGIVNVQAITYDRANNRIIAIGADDDTTPTKVVCCYFDSDWAASSVSDLLTGGPTGLGGRYLQNTVWFGGYLYIIDNNGDVHRGTDYTTTLSSFYTSSDAQIIVALEDRLYLITDTGTIYRLNDADTAFEAYLTPTASLSILFAAPFTQYLALLARRTDSTLDLYRLYPSYTPSLDHLLPIPATAKFPTHALPWAIHHGALLLSTGQYTTPDSSRTYPLFKFNGQTLQLIGHAPTTIGTVSRWTVNSSAIGGPAYIGTTTPTETLTLFTWRTYTLLASIAGANIQIRAQAENQNFITFPTPEIPTPTSSFLPLCTVAGDDLIFIGIDADDNEGLYHTEPDTYHSPATFTTAPLDFGAPGRQKRINRLTAVLSAAHADVTITLAYRIDDTTSWTTATSTSNARRVSIDLNDVQAYTIQVRLTLTDTGDHTINLLDLEIDYT
jgi:hypothetical protein